MRHALFVLALALTGCSTLTRAGERVRILEAPPAECTGPGVIEVTEDCTQHTGRVGNLDRRVIDTCRHWAMVSLRNQAAKLRAGSIVLAALPITSKPRTHR